MTTVPRPGFKQWEIWLYYMHDYHDKTADSSEALAWTPVTDLALPLRLVKPGRSINDGLSVFPEKLFVTARFMAGWLGYTAYVGYFINDEEEPRLVLETTSISAFVNLNGTVDISDIFPMTDGVQMAELGVKYKAAGGLIPSVYLACHQVHYCVRR
jgi:hypothetical protein